MLPDQELQIDIGTDGMEVLGAACYPIIFFDPIPGIRSGNTIPLFIDISSFHHRSP